MPLHRYKCLGCKNEFEEIQKFSDDPLTTCEACGKALERCRGKVSFLLKGGSWSKDGYSATSAPQAVGSEGQSSSEGSPPDDTNFKDVCDRTRKAIIKREYGIDVD